MASRQLISLLAPLAIIGIVTLVVSAPAQARQAKSLGIVPRSGPLANETVYTNSFAVIIGVGKYPNLPKDKQLEFAARDATDLRDLLAASYGFLPDNITILTDDQATKRGIEQALADLGNGDRIKETDRVLVFFSGHGQTVARSGGGETGFLIPFDAKVDLDHPERRDEYSSTCLRMETIWSYLEDCPARHRLLLVDACFGGLIFRTKALGGKPNVAVVKGLLSRPAMQAITAGGKGEEVVEDSRLGHSAFTYKLLEELRALAASPGDVLTASELGAALKNSVSNLTNARQTPQFGNYGGTEGEFLFVSTAPRGGAAATPVVAVPARTADIDLKARLKVTTNVPNAAVTVEGKPVSDGAFAISLPDADRATVRVVVKAAGYEPVGKTVELERGKLAALTLTLKKVATTPHASAPKVAPVPPPVKATVITGTDISSLHAPRTLAEYKAQMVRIPGGTFRMGGSDGDAGEKPIHQVTLSSAFKMGRTPVTVAMWKQYCDATGTAMPPAPEWGWIDDHPIVNVSWIDAKAYCAWAHLTLPTEAQWEYAAKGGQDVIYPWGNTFDPDKLVWDKNSARKTAPVIRSDRVFVNRFGLVDMVGNVWQWCADRRGNYPRGPVRDPTGPRNGSEDPVMRAAVQGGSRRESNWRIQRGGSWLMETAATVFRAAVRYWSDPTRGENDAGFRCVLPGSP